MKAKIKCICGRKHSVEILDGVEWCDCGAGVYVQASGELIFPEVAIDEATYKHKQFLSNQPEFLGYEGGPTLFAPDAAYQPWPGVRTPDHE
jgi:hypothetical protein